MDEHRVGFRLRNDVDAWNTLDTVGQIAGTVVRVSCVAQPCAAFEHARPRSCKKAHLGSELPSLLAAVVKVLSEFGIEEQNRFPDSHPILGPTEAKHVNAALPGKVRRGTTKTRAGISEARPVHMEQQPGLLADGRQRA